MLIGELSLPVPDVPGVQETGDKAICWAHWGVF